MSNSRLNPYATPFYPSIKNLDPTEPTLSTKQEMKDDKRCDNMITNPAPMTNQDTLIKTQESLFKNINTPSDLKNIINNPTKAYDTAKVLYPIPLTPSCMLRKGKRSPEQQTVYQTKSERAAFEEIYNILHNKK